MAPQGEILKKIINIIIIIIFFLRISLVKGFSLVSVQSLSLSLSRVLGAASGDEILEGSGG